MKRKLKKLQQVLAESPGWNVGSSGFYYHSWDKSIDFKMCQYFGCEHICSDGNIINGWIFDESWFEQPVKKKLYAYSTIIPFWNTGNGAGFETIVFVTKEESGDSTFLDRAIRMPAYDIEYGDDK